MIADVIQLFPEVVAQYAAQQQCQRDDVDQLAATAHALARNETVPVFANSSEVQQAAEQNVVEEAVFAEAEDALGD